MSGITIEDSIRHWQRYNLRPVQPEPRRSPSRAVTTMFDLTFISLIITSLFSSHVPGVTAQGATNATCKSSFEWMFNSKHQSPCLVSSWLFTPCSSPSNSFVYPLRPGFRYNTPLNSSTSATPCRCNTVLFSTIAACATCQGGGSDIVPWSTYSQNCSNPGIQKYPVNIPSGTVIPAWAYLDVTVNGTFNPAAAEAKALQNIPDSSAVPSLSTPTSTSGTDNSKYTATDETSDSGSKKSNTGAIAGGVVGALAGLALVGAAAFFALRLRSRRSSAPSGGSQWARTLHSADAQSWEKSPETPVTVSTHRFYNPNDPRTFPGQDPFVSRPLHASVAYSAGVASSNRDTVVTTPNPYRGVPEL